MPEAGFPPFLLPEDDPDIGTLRRGRRPVLFDVLSPDRQTSLLPEGLMMVLHVNPRTMRFNYAKQTNRIQTRGGFLEFHWGDAAEEVTFDLATGGFMRMFAGLSNITGFGAGDQSRRETIAYDKYLDFLALFHNNGAIYDALGNIAVQGYIKMMFDGGTHIGWFDGGLTITEDANQPYMFNLSARFIIDQEEMRFRSANLANVGRAVRVADPRATLGLGNLPSDILQSARPTTSLGSTSTSILDPNIKVGNLERNLEQDFSSFIGLAGRRNPENGGF